MITVLNINTLASIQDLGRYGWRHSGVTVSGAMDSLALRAGNILLDNPEDTPSLEIALGGIQLRFEQDTPFCLTGALYEAVLDDQRIHSYWRYTAHKGQILTLVRAVQGMYGYLCIHGGFTVPPVLHSFSTALTAGFGGFKGRALQAGDQLPSCPESMRLPKVGIASIPFLNTLHAVASSEYEAFDEESQHAFWTHRWTLKSESNRMGYRLQNAHDFALKLKEPLEMLSHAVQFGTVQVPSSGQPIILMADCQTTGGYPKIATVIQADLGRLAQVRFGQEVHFVPVDAQTAHEHLKRQTVYLDQIKEIAHEAR